MASFEEQEADLKKQVRRAFYAKRLSDLSETCCYTLLFL